MTLSHSGRAVLLDCCSLVSRSITNHQASDDVTFSKLESTFPVWKYFDETADEYVADRIDGARIIVTNKVILDRTHLQLAVKGHSRLELICIAATGANNVDLEAAKELGVAVCNVTGYATSSVTEHVFALLLQLMRHLPEYQQAVTTGLWQKSRHFCLLDYPIGDLVGRKIGIIGYGELGRSVARVAEAFGMQVLVCEWPGVDREQRSFEQLIAEVDVLTLHCPLTPVTHHLIGADELIKMQSHALLINTARGGVVDERALYEALVQRQIGGAAVDVLSIEPPNEKQPLLQQHLPNLIVTPHIAWASREARQRLINEVAVNIQYWLSGGVRNRLV